MRLNDDFSLRAVVHAADIPWQPSPMAGVSRRMLDRIGDEVARATSIVAYEPGSRFSAHTHDGGEEFLVLDGVFEDEHGAFPTGTYVRNPPGTSHTPGSAPGCVIFVKLWQFDPDDRAEVRIDAATADTQADPERAGVTVTPLFRDAREDVRLEAWAPGAGLDFTPSNGLEALVLDGSFEEGGEVFRPWSWLRLPTGARLQAVAGPEGARLWVKEGHLAHAGPITAG